MKIRLRNLVTAGLLLCEARVTPREKALHVLNHLAFGPRPGDVDRVLDPAPGSAENAAIDLDGFSGLHPALSPVLPYFKDGSGLIAS